MLFPRHDLSPAGRFQHGFTLIEMLIVVAVIGILTAIGYPQYTAYVERSLRSDAHAGLLRAASEMERCYSREYSYTDCEDFMTSSPDEKYEIELGDRSSFSDDGGFTLIASTEREDGCDKNISINALGERKPEECW